MGVVMGLPSILLVDDKQDVLAGLKAELTKLLPAEAVEIRTWVPDSEDEDEPDAAFDARVDDDTVLVATDYDLTGNGITGLFGLTIVGWCQSRSIPVGDFSRGHTNELPDEPNLFELRVPPNDVEGAQFIASAFRGFESIRHALKNDPQIMPARGGSLSGALARLLGRPNLDDQFALYMSKLGAANAALLQQLRDFGSAAKPPTEEQKVRVVTYVLGHVLLNSILKFPGPLLSSEALCAYAATANAESNVLDGVFSDCRYEGPFSESARFYWREDADVVLYEAGKSLSEADFDGFGDFNRAALEILLERALTRHVCQRDGCRGEKGGFLCPFTHRPVCERSDCSVLSSGWIPQGADLSRVERTYYDEWAPLLGL
ncbi:hypothetical protein ACVIHH_004490 [Bradyrhizobium sp. USDA 4518]